MNKGLFMPKYLLIFIISIITFLILLCASSLIPSKYLKSNVIKSANILQKQTNEYVIRIRGFNIPFDNHTDSLMINTSYSIDSNKPLYSSLVARKNYIPNVTKTIHSDTIGELKSSKLGQVGDLIDTINENVYESYEYARYWHGYLVFLRPLLLLFDISGIRIINIILFLILGIIFLYLVYKKIGLIESIIMLIGLFSVDYFYIGLSLQGTPVFLIMIISSIFILLKYNKIKNINIVFFIIGIILAFTDFLTNPLITLGIPMTIYFLLKQKNEGVSLKETIKILIYLCISWSLGYLITWFTKWVIVDLLYGKSIINTSINQLFYRVGINDTPSIIETILKNLYCVMPMLLIIILSTLAFVILKKKIRFNLTLILPYMFICILPFIWYMLLRNHSLYHCGFTYRTLILTLTCIPLTLVKSVKK